ncbi:MAG: type II toxin-antitoxin system VapC family toxin [Treponema sp.]|jgi:predicted nucleic acid-binding protein|nr:type II toxin-antitoxin system VapC family toxin [Treponema sp.]
MLDTNVISELQKSNCNQNIRAFVEENHWEDLYLSVISYGELCYGVERLPEGKKKHDLLVWVYTKIPEWFKGRIIGIDTDVMLEWGKIRARAKRSIPVADSLIAASAITNHIFLVTRNTSDFDGIDGINIINPWEF